MGGKRSGGTSCMLSDDTAFLLVTGALRKGARARTPRDRGKSVGMGSK